MADNIGNLAVVMSLNAQQFNAGLRETATQIDQIQVDVTRMSATMNAAGNVVAASAQRQSVGMRFLSGAMQQGSFAAQDFASQLSTRGLGGALQAASNNIQVMGSAFGPWGMAISAATGLAVQGLGTYLLMSQKTGDKTKESTAAIRGHWETVFTSFGTWSYKFVRDAEDVSEAIAKINKDIYEERRAGRRTGAEFNAGIAFDAAAGSNSSVSELERSIQSADRRSAQLQARREVVLKDFDKTIKDRFGDLTGDQTATEFFDLGTPGASGLDVTQKLRDIGFEVSSKMLLSINRLDRELTSIDTEARHLYAESTQAAGFIPEARMRERFKKESDAAAKRVAEEMRIADESRNAVLGDVNITSDIQRRRDALNRAFNRGGITQLEKTIGEQRIAADENRQRNAVTGPRALSRNSDEVFAMMQRALRGETGANDKQESIKKNTADTAKATQDTAKAVKKMTERPVVVVRF